MGTLFSLSKSATLIALDVSEIALLLFGLLLVAGLIGEYATSERWKRHVKVFEMLVIIGVAGELLGDGGIFLFSSHLQTIADQEIAALTKEAGNAKDSAEGAAAAASRAEDSARQASDEAGKAVDRSRKANMAASHALVRAHDVKRYADLLAKNLNPRWINFESKRFIELLKGKPRGTAEIWYEPNDNEAYMFASQLHHSLGPGGAGWNVLELKSLPAKQPRWDLPIGHRSPLDELRIEAYTGLAITSNKLFPYDQEGKTAWGALWRAIWLGTGGWGISGIGGHMMTPDPTLPDNYFVIVVGHRQINVPLWTPPWENERPYPPQTIPRIRTK